MAELQDAFDKIKAGYDNVQASMSAAETALANTKVEQVKAEAALQAAKQEHGALLGQLDAKKTEADKAAEEAATRIQLNRDQTAELLRLKAEADKKLDVAERSQAMLNAMKQKLDAKEAELQAREQEVVKAENKMAARRAKLQEALS
jgi:hypothetical protein